MFIGHYAIALAAKKVAPKVSLGTTLCAAEFLDFVWPVLQVRRQRVHVATGVLLPVDHGAIRKRLHAMLHFFPEEVGITKAARADKEENVAADAPLEFFRKLEIEEPHHQGTKIELAAEDDPHAGLLGRKTPDHVGLQGRNRAGENHRPYFSFPPAGGKQQPKEQQDAEVDEIGLVGREVRPADGQGQGPFSGHPRDRRVPEFMDPDDKSLEEEAK
ncbi:MAG: hypothetical protein EXS39_02155 [Opitutaceae bacterium]|nr:hypothetical protein [Opitutaceae bacterium]